MKGVISARNLYKAAEGDAWLEASQRRGWASPSRGPRGKRFSPLFSDGKEAAMEGSPSKKQLKESVCPSSVFTWSHHHIHPGKGHFPGALSILPNLTFPPHPHPPSLSCPAPLPEKCWHFQPGAPDLFLPGLSELAGQKGSN